MGKQASVGFILDLFRLILLTSGHQSQPYRKVQEKGFLLWAFVALGLAAQGIETPQEAIEPHTS